MKEYLNKLNEYGIIIIPKLLSDKEIQDMNLRYRYYYNCIIEFPDPIERYCKICNVVH